jgi:SAM-dependent methyltransferase
MKRTSERVTETREGTAVWELHMAAYRWAVTFSAGKRVFDYGCGSGYGAAYLADTAAHVTGYDIDPDAVDYANDRHRAANVEFTTDKPPDGSYDIALSFQVIEHVAPDPYLSDVRRCLRPGGILLVTTPNRSVRLYPWQKPWNRWHLTEYDRAGLTDLLHRHFSSVEAWRFNCPPEIETAELARYRRTRNLLLPATLVPWYSLRFHLLNLAASAAPGGQRSARVHGTVTIERAGPDSLCLAASAIV